MPAACPVPASPRYARERSRSDLPTPLGPVMNSVSPEDSENESESRMTRDCCAPRDRVSCRTSSWANVGSAGGGDMPGAGKSKGCVQRQGGREGA